MTTTVPAGRAPSMQSLALIHALPVTLQPLAGRLPAGGPALRAARRLIDAVGLLPLPPGTTCTPLVHAGRRAVAVQAAGASADTGGVLYLHGGGFVLGSSRSHRALAARLSQAGGAVVVVPDYRRAPEDPFPASADDVHAWYEWLRTQGHPANRIVVAGDSCGGHLAAGLLRTGAPPPAGVVLFSPLLDLGFADAEARARRRGDPFSSVAFGRRAVAAYLAGSDPGDPRIDVLDGDFSAWPPTLIQVGGTELLLDDARRLADRLDACGTDHELQIWRGQVHSFHLMALAVPEARRAIDHAGEFVRARIDNAHIDNAHIDNAAHHRSREAGVQHA